MKICTRALLVALTLVALGLAGCSGGGGGDEEPEPRSDWDALVWDDAEWA